MYSAFRKESYGIVTGYRQENGRESFALALRIGMVSMSVIQKAEHQILIGKYRPSSHFQQAMFQDDDLCYAESLVKNFGQNNPFLLSEDEIKASGSSEGFECRWNEILNPLGETVAILVQALEQDILSKEIICNEVSQKILDIYRDEEAHHPLRQEQLSLTTSLVVLSNEIIEFEPSSRIHVNARYML